MTSVVDSRTCPTAPIGPQPRWPASGRLLGLAASESCGARHSRAARHAQRRCCCASGQLFKQQCKGEHRAVPYASCECMLVSPACCLASTMCVDLCCWSRMSMHTLQEVNSVSDTPVAIRFHVYEQARSGHSKHDMHFGTLGLPIRATAQHIRRAYLQLAAQWHPDKWAMADATAQETAASQFRSVKAAYDALVCTEVGTEH